MSIIAIIIGTLSAMLAAFLLGRSHRPVQPQPEADAAPPPTNGVYVEVDCRDCLQFNRVPIARLRDRPHCGRCKGLLAPKRRFVIHKVSDLDAVLSSDLDRLWTDPDRLWHRVADHLSAPRKAVN